MTKIRLVDGFKIRNTKDIDFGCVEDSLTCPFIPKNETWLDQAFSKEKKSLLDTFIKKRSLMKKFGYEKAKQILRQKMTNISTPKKIKIKLLEKQGPQQIWLVSGKNVRKYYDPNFIFGGHSLVYEYIPKNDIWIDDSTLTKERKYVLIHELFELKLMKKGKTYNDAHDFASAREKEARRADGVAKYFKD